MADDFLETTQEVTVSDRDSLARRGKGTGKALLILLVGGRPGERAFLDSEKFAIGRGSAADLVLESDAVSRVHAFIEKRGADHFLVDNNSTNGSYVNYRRVKERQLEDGDQIQIGQSMLKYLSGDNIETSYYEEFRRLARRDALTGALNRATFDEELRVLVAASQREKSPLSLIMFDLDHMKKINDAHGHTAGDLVLSFLGEKVQEMFSVPHLFARLGGEEFAVLFQGSGPAATLEGENLRRRVEEIEVDYDGTHIPITVSVGVAELEPTKSALDLYEAADRKLYAAKAGGRNRVAS